MTGVTSCAACWTPTGPGRRKLGGAEDSDLDERYDRARDLLWTAPCDLPAAADAVTGYQQAVLSLGATGAAAMTTTATKCVRPGCGGTIDGGYCDTCGLAPDPVAATAVSPAPAPAPAPAAAPAPATCTRPGCGGTIEDGYCNTCGLAPVRQPAASAARPVRQRRRLGSPAAALPGRPAPAPPAADAGSRRTRSGSTRSSRGHLGAGLVEIPPVPGPRPGRPPC